MWLRVEKPVYSYRPAYAENKDDDGHNDGDCEREKETHHIFKT